MNGKMRVLDWEGTLQYGGPGLLAERVFVGVGVGLGFHRIIRKSSMMCIERQSCA